MVSLKQEFELYDYLGPVAVISLFAITILFISFFILNFFFISKHDEPTVFERLASKHNLRLGPHSVKAVISRKQRYMKDSSGDPDGSVPDPGKVAFKKQPEPQFTRSRNLDRMFGSCIILMVPRLCRNHFQRNISSKQLMYEKYGHPPDVLNLVTKELGKLNANEVLVRWMAAPINPADINQVQGSYPRKPPLPAVGGLEGFGQVEEIGSEVTNLHPGDWVVPGVSFGSWRTFGKHFAKDLFKIARDLPFDSAATLQVNPPTAYRMLKDFVNLKAGDLVVQNGANSNVGRYVIQLCKLWNIRTVNFVRSRENLDVLVRELKELGADEVFTEEEMAKEPKNRAKNAQLALNCVGGRNAMLLSTCLSNKGVMVTYGGMSRKPIEVPTGLLIFKDIKLVGFWVSQWYATEGNEKDCAAMFEELQDLIKNGKLHSPKLNKLKLEDWKTAITNAVNSSATKQLLVMQ